MQNVQLFNLAAIGYHFCAPPPKGRGTENEVYRMKCPFCGEEMILGRIQPAGWRIPYWLPDKVVVKDLPFYLTAKRIERAGGRIVGTATNIGIGLVAEELCGSALCETCNLLITQL